jgi:translation elongation factor EF-Ts
MDQITTPDRNEMMCLVEELRGATGAPMMECKKALYNCHFDIYEATKYLESKDWYRGKLVTLRYSGDSR